MIKTLRKVGNGYALFLDRAILDLLEIEPDQPLELEVRGDVLLVRPVRDPKRAKRLQDARQKVRTRYARTFKRLAE